MSLKYGYRLGFASALAFAFVVQAAALADDGLTPEQRKRADAISAGLAARPSAFRRIITSSKSAGIMAETSEGIPGCGEAVRSAYVAGGTLYSPIIDEAASKLADFPKGSGVQDNVYYHFTRSQKMMNAFGGLSGRALQDELENVFVYLRIRPANFNTADSSYHANWGRVFYISEDEASISFYSPYEISFELSADARVVDLNKNLWQRALEDLGARYPEIGRKCGTAFNTQLRDANGWVEYHALAFLVAEDSGVDAIYYFQANHWFQIVSPLAFRSSKALGRTGGGYSNGNDTYERQDLSFLGFPTIEIVSATYAGADVTEKAAAFANGKTSATYMISKRFLGEPAAGAARMFRIRWKCLKGGDARQPVGAVRGVDLAAGEAEEGTKVELSCST